MENKHHEHVIRMKWLSWSARPVVMVWDFIIGGLGLLGEKISERPVVVLD